MIYKKKIGPVCKIIVNFSGLTVFAIRSLKNALYGKPARISQSPKVSSAMRENSNK